MKPFECGMYIIIKLRKVVPKPNLSQDELLFVYVRWINLDLFWACVTATTNQNRGQVNELPEFSNVLGVSESFECEGPYPEHNHCGY